MMRTFARTSVLIPIPTKQSKEVPVMHNAHLTALEAKHAVLDQRIAQETLRPMPDAILIADLKKQKLRLKEVISAAH